MQQDTLNMASESVAQSAAKPDWVNELFSKIDKIDSRFDTLDVQFKALHVKVDSIETVSTENSQALGALRETVTKTTNELEEVKCEMKACRQENIHLRDTMLNIECDMRASCFIVNGIYEGEYENCQSIIRDLINVKLDIPNVSIVTCYRQGFPSKHRDRSIKVELHHRVHRDRVLAAGYKLKGTQIYISEDLPNEINRRRRKLFAVTRSIQRNDGYKAQVIRDKLKINGRTYDTNDLDQLPQKLNPLTLAIKQNDEVFAFGGPLSDYLPICNYYCEPFTHEGILYKSAEHGIQHKKALLFDDYATAEKILKTDLPSDAKQLGYNVNRMPNYTPVKWVDEIDDLIIPVLTSKFEQCANAKSMLLLTQEKTIAEASRDKVWGAGRLLHDEHIFNKNHYKGLNTLGDLLQKVRQIIRRDSDITREAA